MEVRTSKEDIVRQDRIYADTCALMHINKFIKFLNIYGDILLQNNKQIHINQAVQLELIKLATGEDKVKSALAGKALNLLRNRSDIFYTEGAITDFSTRNLNSAFFDKTMLMKLISSRPYQSIMLITEDLDLCHDVNLINEIRSIEGKRNIVCCIKPRGELFTVINQVSDIVSNEAETITEEGPVEHNASDMAIGVAIGVGGTLTVLNVARILRNFSRAIKIV